MPNIRLRKQKSRKKKTSGKPEANNNLRNFIKKYSVREGYGRQRVHNTFLPAFVFTPKGNGYTCRTYTSQGIRDIRISDKKVAFCIALVFN
jgi:N-methylhydantoinase A/oxoprolinase/acetone carboxylase beta subunit